MKEFVLLGPDHVITLLLVAVASILAFAAARSRWAGTLNALGGGLFGLLAVGLWLLRLENGFQPAEDLPLWLCDIAFLLCLGCFVRPNETMLILVAYWGLAGTLQAMLTPDLLYAFPSRQFLLFFIGHSIIVVGVFFLLGRSRPARLPTRYGVAVAFAGLLIYTALVGTLDALFGWNYGYLCRKPQGASILDGLGDWPGYIGAALVVALVLFTAVAGLLRVLWNFSPGERSGHRTEGSR